MSASMDNLIGETLGNLKQMMDVNTIIGEPIITKDGTTVIPVSKVSMGFASGGCEFNAKKSEKDTASPMFGGGSGGGVSLNPVAFLVAKNDTIRLLPVSDYATVTDRIIDMIPDALSKFNKMIKEFKIKKDDIQG